MARTWTIIWESALGPGVTIMSIGVITPCNESSFRMMSRLLESLLQWDAQLLGLRTVGFFRTCIYLTNFSGKVYGFGYDSSGQLGLGIKDEDEEKVVSTPRKITSAHLEDYKVEAVSLADQHAIFLAKHVERA